MLYNTIGRTLIVVIPYVILLVSCLEEKKKEKYIRYVIRLFMCIKEKYYLNLQVIRNYQCSKKKNEAYNKN